MTTHLLADQKDDKVRSRCGVLFPITRRHRPFADRDVSAWHTEVTCDACIPAPAAAHPF